MNKRKRKKFHVGEYTELGFVIKAEANLVNNSPEGDQFADGMVDFVEGRGCCIGGGVGDKVNVFCTRIERGSCTEDDRQAITQYLKDHSLVTRFVVGPLVDAWNSPDVDYDLEF